MSAIDPKWPATRSRIRDRLKAFLRAAIGERSFRQMLESRPSAALQRFGLQARIVPKRLWSPSHVSVHLDETTLFGSDCTTDVEPELQTIPLEMRLVVYGAKSLALCYGTSDAISQYTTWARRRSLVTLLSPFQGESIPEQGQPDFWNCIPLSPARGAGGERGLLVAANESQAILGWLSLLFSWHGFLGFLLGTPRCCCNWFDERNWDITRATDQGDLAVQSLRSSGSGPFDWHYNVFARYFGYRLLFHFPCNFRCPATYAGALWHLNSLRVHEPAYAQELSKVLAAAVVHAGAQGVFLFPGATVESQPDGSRRFFCQPATMFATVSTSNLAQALLHCHDFVCKPSQVHVGTQRFKAECTWFTATAGGGVSGAAPRRELMAVSECRRLREQAFLQCLE